MRCPKVQSVPSSLFVWLPPRMKGEWQGWTGRQKTEVEKLFPFGRRVSQNTGAALIGRACSRSSTDGARRPRACGTRTGPLRCCIPSLPGAGASRSGPDARGVIVVRVFCAATSAQKGSASSIALVLPDGPAVRVTRLAGRCDGGFRLASGSVSRRSRPRARPRHRRTMPRPWRTGSRRAPGS